MLELRDYQTRALEQARAAFVRGQQRSLIVAPTGAGKTVIACAFVAGAAKKGSRTLFLTHREELIQQTSRKLDEIGILHGVVRAGSKRQVAQLAGVEVAAIQTLNRRLAHLGTYPVVIVDEAHHANAESWSRVIQATQCRALLGLTATPYRMDGKALGDLFDNLIVVSSLGQLIEGGYLVEPRVLGREPPSLDTVKIAGHDYNLTQLAGVIDRPELVDDIVAAWRQHAAGRTTVAFASSIDHSKHIAAAFNAAGVKARHIDGNLPVEERTAILGELATGVIEVVSNCAILTEGWDLPRCSAVIIARPTQSRSLWKQMCGRALRPWPEMEKRDCVILDHAGCWKRHGFLTDPEEPSLQGRERKDSAAPRFHCPNCDAEFPGWPRFCPECGLQLPRSTFKQAAARAEGEMVEVGRRSPKDELERLLVEARAMGRSPTWATRKFKTRFGRWPDGSLRSDDPALQLSWSKHRGRWRLEWKEP